MYVWLKLNIRYRTSLAMGASLDGMTRTSGLRPFNSQCLEWRKSYCLFVTTYIHISPSYMEKFFAVIRYNPASLNY